MSKKTKVIIVVAVVVVAVAIAGVALTSKSKSTTEFEDFMAPSIGGDGGGPVEGRFSTEIGESKAPGETADEAAPGEGERGPGAPTGVRPRSPRGEGGRGDREWGGGPRGEGAPSGAGPRGERGPGGEGERRERGQWLRERLTEEQYAQYEKKRTELRESGATREESRAALRELLQSFGVEMPERRSGGPGGPGSPGGPGGGGRSGGGPGGG